MSHVHIANTILGTLTLLSHIFLLILLIGWIKQKITKKPPHWFTKIIKTISAHQLLFGVVVSLTAVLGSLYYSEVAQFHPCKLCWMQRICIYPIALLLLVAYQAKERGVKKYVIPLAIIGWAIAAYHYVLQMVNTFTKVPDAFTPCSTVGMTPSCVSYFFLQYGYITIPMMSLTVCTLLLVCFFLKHEKTQ